MYRDFTLKPEHNRWHAAPGCDGRHSACTAAAIHPADCKQAVRADHRDSQQPNLADVQVLRSLTAGEAATDGVMTQSQVMLGTLDAELQPLILSKAAQYGLPAAWVYRLAKLDWQRRQVSPHLAGMSRCKPGQSCLLPMLLPQCISLLDACASDMVLLGIWVLAS